MKMIRPPKRRKRGRPYTGGRDPQVAVRLPPEMLKRIDALAARKGISSRSEVIRAFIDAGLKASKPSRKKPKARG